MPTDSLQLNVFPEVLGIRLATVCAQIKSWQRDDLLLIDIIQGAAVSALFTQNTFCAAPVTLARKHLRCGEVRALLINAGNANAATGMRGLADTQATCNAVAQVLGINAEQVMPFSTGVIGEYLPLMQMLDAIPRAAAQLASKHWPQAARAIMTTDTIAKIASRNLEIKGTACTIAGIAKGSGMIRPNMATMLAFVATDAAISQPLLDKLMNEAVAVSFNRISVDGDCSTNDACVLIASGAMGAVIEDEQSIEYQQLKAKLLEIYIELAKGIVSDGEGASKLVTIQVNNATSSEEAFKVAYKVGESPLVKTALYASDPNWGRLIMAIGNSGIDNLKIDKVAVYLDDIPVVKAGERADSYSEEMGLRVFKQEAFTITVDLNRGDSCEHIWSCDLSHEYVTINAEYRS